jgi:hypothetical protein
LPDAAILLGLLVLHLVLTALPGVAAVLLGAHLGLRSVPLLLALGLFATAALAMLDFWAFYAEPMVGKSLAFLIVFGSVLTIGWLLWERRIERALLRQLSIPLALWALGTGFLAFLGFVHGDVNDPIVTSMTRFSGVMPTDNIVPLYFSDWFFHHGRHGTPPPFAGDWLSSDRPPLQIGFTLLQRTFFWDNRGMNYQAMGIGLQQLWIVGLWALLLAGRPGRVTRAVALGTVLLSDIAIVNGFFVWPKMLPAALLLAAAALVLTPLWDEVKGSLWGAALFAGLLALALLGHGANVFGALPLALVALFRSGLPSWRWLGVAALVGLVLMTPWSAYQRWGDPPGNRLTKWYLGGAVDIDQRGIGETIVDGYREAGLGGTIDNKSENFAAIVGADPDLFANNVETARNALDAGDWENVVRPIRSIFFFSLLPSLGLLLLGPLAMAVGYRRRARAPNEWRLAVACLGTFALGTLLWALILFGGFDAQAVIHQGSYLLPVLGIVAGVLGLRAVYPRFALWWLGLNAVLILAIYIPAYEPPEGTSFSLAMALLAAASLAGFAAVTLDRGAE